MNFMCQALLAGQSELAARRLCTEVIRRRKLPASRRRFLAANPVYQIMVGYSITRADRLNERTAELLAQLGCMRVWIGSESGSQRILDAMERGVRVEQVRSAVALCKRMGIQTGMFLMWGYDGEEIPDIEATVDHVKQCRPDVFFTTVSYPIKGTPYFNKVADRLVALGGWHEQTDRDFKIRGRHSRNFYRHADELLRSETAENADISRIAAARAALHDAASEVEV